jgi:hypothetical protein
VRICNPFGEKVKVCQSLGVEITVSYDLLHEIYISFGMKMCYVFESYQVTRVNEKSIN